MTLSAVVTRACWLVSPNRYAKFLLLRHPCQSEQTVQMGSALFLGRVASRGYVSPLFSNDIVGACANLLASSTSILHFPHFCSDADDVCVETLRMIHSIIENDETFSKQSPGRFGDMVHRIPRFIERVISFSTNLRRDIRYFSTEISFRCCLLRP
jgi:hypothetical protein